MDAVFDSIYFGLVDPPNVRVRSVVDERGNSRPVAFMQYRVNGQYIMEGLAASFMFTLGGVGFILLDITASPTMPKLNRLMLTRPRLRVRADSVHGDARIHAHETARLHDELIMQHLCLSQQ
ncbi:unnamed protein product [Sphagnum balticum]